MATFNDLFGNQGNNFGQQIDESSLPAPAGSDQMTWFATSDLDNQWAKGYVGDLTTKAPHSYFNYFFTGEDVRVYIDGTEDDNEFHDIPIIDFGFNVNQQKMPVYGHWSYTYDAVMRGTRIISGVFTIATKSPHYMRDILTKAAASRAARTAPYHYYRGLTEDDSNIQKYWGKNMDPAVQAAGNNIFSAHPPFSFVIVYGVQSYSIDAAGTMSWASGDLLEDYVRGDSPLWTDTNDRLVESDPNDQTTRIVLDACEIQSVKMQFAPDGQPLAEMYQFFARDIIVPVSWGNQTSSTNNEDTDPDSNDGKPRYPNPPHVK